MCESLWWGLWPSCKSGRDVFCPHGADKGANSHMGQSASRLGVCSRDNVLEEHRDGRAVWPGESRGPLGNFYVWEEEATGPSPVFRFWKHIYFQIPAPGPCACQLCLCSPSMSAPQGLFDSQMIQKTVFIWTILLLHLNYCHTPYYALYLGPISILLIYFKQFEFLYPYGIYLMLEGKLCYRVPGLSLKNSRLKLDF